MWCENRQIFKNSSDPIAAINEYYDSIVYELAKDYVRNYILITSANHEREQMIKLFTPFGKII